MARKQSMKIIKLEVCSVVDFDEEHIEREIRKVSEQTHLLLHTLPVKFKPVVVVNRP